VTTAKFHQAQNRTRDALKCNQTHLAAQIAPPRHNGAGSAQTHWGSL